MASTETTAAQSTNGASARTDIEVENPATGRVIATVPDLGPEQVKALVAKARADTKKAAEHAAKNFSKTRAYNCTVQPQPKK